MHSWEKSKKTTGLLGDIESYLPHSCCRPTIIAHIPGLPVKFPAMLVAIYSPLHVVSRTHTHVRKTWLAVGCLVDHCRHQGLLVNALSCS